MVSPIKMRQLPKVLKSIKTLSRFVEVDGVDVLGAMTECSEDLVRAVAAAVEMPEEWVMSLDLDEMVRVIRVVAEVNADFFVGAVLPEINQLPKIMERLTGSISSRA